MKCSWQIAVPDAHDAYLAGRLRPEEFRCAGGQGGQGVRGLRGDLVSRAVKDNASAAVVQDGGA
jgi:hypothetical protein